MYAIKKAAIIVVLQRIILMNDDPLLSSTYRQLKLPWYTTLPEVSEHIA